MIYPKNYEQKIGFDEIRTLLSRHCASSMGQELIEKMTFQTDLDILHAALEQTREFMHLLEAEDRVPEMEFFDLRPTIQRIRIEGTFIEEQEMWDLKRSLDTLHAFIDIIRREPDEAGSLPTYPTLVRLAWVVLGTLGGCGIIAYILAAIIIPMDPAGYTDRT